VSMGRGLTILTGVWLIGAALTSSLVCPVTAQESLPLVADLAANTPQVRIGESMPTIWEVQKYQPGLLDGRFEFRVHLGAKEFYTYVTDELVLHQPDQRLRFLFPPIRSTLRSPEIEIDVRWLPKVGQPLVLRPQLLRVPFNARRTLLMGVIEERRVRGRPADWDQRLNALVPEVYGSQSNQPQQYLNSQAILLSSSLQTVFIGWEGEESPADPQALFAYDAIAIHGPQFVRLRPPQLRALAMYCRAGGSLYIEPTGILESAHVEFLSDLTRDLVEFDGWHLDDQGAVIWPTEIVRRGGLLVNCGLGRVVIVDPARWSQMSPRTVTAQLWRYPVNFNPIAAIEQDTAFGNSRWTSRGQLNSKVQLHDQVGAFLLPDNIQVLPLWLVIVILLLLVFLIGPLDWWLLGKWKLRRFTWLTWPVWMIVATISMVLLSNWYLETTGQPRELVLHDLDIAGEPLRSFHFRMVFPSRARTEEHTLAHTVWEPLGGMQRDQNPHLRTLQVSAQFYIDDDQRDVTTPSRYVGRFPQQYTITRGYAQWVPELAFGMALPSALEPPPSRIDWSALDEIQWSGKRSLLEQQVADRLQPQIKQPFAVSLSDAQNLRFSSLIYPAGARATPLMARLGTLPVVLTKSEHSPGELQLQSAWHNDPTRRIFLPALSESSTWKVLVVVIDDGDRITVYRRMLSTEQPNPLELLAPEKP
jgi:hypothetical protein